MKAALLLILVVLIVGCVTNSKLTDKCAISENNKDVYILAKLIRDHLRTTNGGYLDLNELIKNDTINRISRNFKKFEPIYRGDHISVYFVFSDSRDEHNTMLTTKEIEISNSLEWINKKSNGKYDGEIQFDYEERFYRIRKISIIRQIKQLNNCY